MRESPLKDRANSATRRYRHLQHGKRDGDHSQFNRILKPDCNVAKITWLTYDHPTTVRIFPALDPEDNTRWDTWRLSPEPGDWGDWVRTYPCAYMVGNPPTSFLLYDPLDKESDAARANPYWMLRDAIYTACQNDRNEDPTWNDWLKGEGKAARLSKVVDISLLQCAVYRRNGELLDPPQGSAPNDPTPIMMLKSSATEAMFDFMERIKENYNGDLMDFDSAYECGDPVALSSGAFVTFYKEGDDPFRNVVKDKTERKSSFGKTRDTRQQKTTNKKGQIPLYDCIITKEFDGQAANLEEYEDLIRQKVHSWESILNFPTVEEQIQWISKHFPSNMVAYAFRTEYRDLVPDFVFEKAVNRVSSGPMARRQPNVNVESTETEVETPPVVSRSGFGGRNNRQPVVDDVVPDEDLPNTEAETDDYVPEEALDDVEMPQSVAKERQAETAVRPTSTITSDAAQAAAVLARARATAARAKAAKRSS